MKSKYIDKFAAGAAEYLEPGEEVRAALIAQARGRSQRITAAGTSFAVSEMGARKQQRSIAAADEAGLVIDNPMALVLTSQRLLTFKISTPILGRGGQIKALLGDLPLDAVDSLEVKRAGLGRKITITIAGTAVDLEAAAGADELAAAFAGARSTG